jgi:hypothetical protein
MGRDLQPMAMNAGPTRPSTFNLWILPRLLVLLAIARAPS